MDIKDISNNMNQWINETFNFQNPVYGEIIWSIILLILFFVIGWFVSHIFKHYFLRWSQKTKTTLDDEILKNVKRPIHVLVIFFGIYLSINNISILYNYIDKNIVDTIFLLIEILLIAYIFTRITNVLISWYARRQQRIKKQSQHVLYVFRGILNGIIYLIAFFVFMAIAGIDLTGLAIGGAATAIIIGFALQHVLSDFFSAFSIYFDRPFEIGDFIIIGEYSGIVTKIGMKSTRIELLQGEELIVSNKELTTVSIRNFKKMNKRRVEFSFGVTYDTPLKKLKKIPDIIGSIINSEKLKYVHKLDRVHFTEFGDFSLNFNVIYYLNTKDYTKYRDIQQDINFQIIEAFEKEGIEMAYPTQTIILNKSIK